MSPRRPDSITPVQRNLHRLHLCREVIETVLNELEPPETSDDKADLLLASEHLMESLVKLHREIYQIVWNEELDLSKEPKTEE